MVIENTDAPFILRDILQNTDRLQKDSELTKNKMQDTQKPLSNPNENQLSGNELNGDHVTRSDRDSETGSDEESSFLDQSRVDEAEVDDGKSDADESQSNADNTSGEESKEAKRARVENLLTAMHNPSPYMDMEMYGLSEVRRQKRKQSLPQQHEPPSKFHRPDLHSVDEELLGLQRLSAMQNYFRQYEEVIPKPMNGFEGMENIHRFHQAYFANLSARHSEEMQKERTLHTRPVLASLEKKVTCDKDHFNIAEHVRETMNANKGLSQGVAELNDKELNELIASLKSKIEEAVSVTVDKELSKFFSKRNKQKDSIKEPVAPRDEHVRNGDVKHEPEKKPTDHSLNSILQLPDKTNKTNSTFRLQGQSAFELPKLNSGLQEMPRPPFPHHAPLGYHPLSFYLPTSLHQPSMYPCPIVPPEQNEPLSLVVNTPKKKRTKVTDTRLSPRAARALLHENSALGSFFDHERAMTSGFGPLSSTCLPTSVAIPNPSLQNSDIMSFYKDQGMCNSPSDNDRNTPRSNSPSDGGYSFMKSDFYSDGDSFDAHGKQTTDTLTPMHLRKAKLMFFYVRYPSSAILKVYFPDVQFNKNNTAQLVKWFSNFREFFYIQMEKYARQAKVENVKHSEDLVVTTESELYRVLNLHYNRNNQIEVPENFRLTVQATLREFFLAIMANKDLEPSWKKPIYKVIARLDDAIPEFFKSPNWMDQLSDS